jgi:sec-independent protein translocase protein TatA
MLSPWEIGVVGVVVVLLFGTKRLPELGSGLGKAISNFKRSYKESTELDITPKHDKQEAQPKREGEVS